MDASETEKLIGELEVAVDRLRSLYEQYFMGIEKLEPSVPRKDVDRRIYALRKEQIRNTALRFRFHMLVQRYNTYETHWQRICRDIENGTYKRHVIRAQRRFGVKRASVRPPSGPPGQDRSLAAQLAELDREFAPAETLDDGDVELEEEPPSTERTGTGGRTAGATRPPASHRTPRPPPSRPALRTPRPPPPSRPAPRVAPPPPPRTPSPPRAPPPTPLSAPRPDSRPALAPPASRPRPPSHAPATPRSPLAARRDGDLPDDRVRQLYIQYIETKRRQNESTAAITYEAVARSLRESNAKLRQKLGRPVDFEVAVKDGRAILRPVVK